jgi:hypothetical protein
MDARRFVTGPRWPRSRRTAPSPSQRSNCYAFWEDPSGFGAQGEALLGRWLARRPGVRDRVKISITVGCEPTVAGRFPETAEGLSAAEPHMKPGRARATPTW